MREQLSDRENQRAVARELAIVWGDKADLQFIELPDYSIIDYLVIKECVPAAWLEVKCATANVGQYPFVQMDLEKYIRSQKHAARTGYQYILVIAAPNGIFVSNETTAVRETGWMPKNDGTGKIVECVKIPYRDFKRQRRIS